jgi:RNA recognition motif-containing protein
MPVRLFVGNLPYDVSEAEVREFFSVVAPPQQVFLPVDRDTGRPRGFAFVEFGEAEHGEQAIARLNNQPLKGRTISVSEARARDSRGPGGPPPGGRPPMRPPGGPGGPPRGDRPFRPSFGGPPPPAPGGRDFDEEQRRRRTAKPTQARNQTRQEKERGPIPIRGGGRLYSVDDDDQYEGEDVQFDNFATSEPDEDEGKE